MQPKTSNDYERMLARFYDFGDGVIRGILLRYEAGGTRMIEIQVATRDSETIENEGWVIVRIAIRDVAEFAVREGSRTPIQVLSQGIHLLCLDNQVGVEFGGATDRPESFETLRLSDGYVVGREVEFHVEPWVQMTDHWR